MPLVIVELLVFRGNADNHTVRYEQHPTGKPVTEDNVRTLLGAHKSNTEVLTVKHVGQRQQPSGSVIDTWAVHPDPWPTHPTQPISDLANSITSEVQEIAKAATQAERAIFPPAGN